MTSSLQSGVASRACSIDGTSRSNEIARKPPSLSVVDSLDQSDSFQVRPLRLVEEL